MISTELTTQIAILMYEDGVIDKYKAELASELNRAIEDEEQYEPWSRLFVKIISDFLLQGPSSPGEIDELECEWLMENVFVAKELGTNEKRLLQYLKEHSVFIPQRLKNLKV